MFSKKSRPALGPTRTIPGWASVAISPEVTRLLRRVEHWLLCHVEVKDECSCTSTPPHAFRDNFASTSRRCRIISLTGTINGIYQGHDNIKKYHHHHHHISVMELGHLLTRSGLTYPEVSSKVYHDSFCQFGSSISLPWVIYFEAFYLHVVSSFFCIPVICPKLVLFLTSLQFVHLFCNLSKCILLFFSCITSLLLLFFWRHLL